MNWKNIGRLLEVLGVGIILFLAGMMVLGAFIWLVENGEGTLALLLIAGIGVFLAITGAAIKRYASEDSSHTRDVGGGFP